MTAIAAPLDIDFPPFAIAVEGWQWCERLYHRHSDMITSVANLALNTTILATKIFQQIPQALARTSYTLLSFTGICSLNIQCRDLLKSGKDLLISLRAMDVEGILVTAVKVMVKGINILCTGGMFGAAIATMLARPEIALVMYAVMRPFSLCALAAGIGTEFYDYKRNRDLLRELTEIEQDRHRRIEAVMRHFVHHLQTVKGEGGGDNTDKKLARRLFRQVEHFTAENLLGELQKKHGKNLGALGAPEAQRLFAAVTQSLKDKQNYTKSNLGLIALGYGVMALCRRWPDSLVQSASTWGMSLLYTSKLAYQKVAEARLRKKL